MPQRNRGPGPRDRSGMHRDAGQANAEDQRLIRQHISWLVLRGRTDATRYQRERALRRLLINLPKRLKKITEQDLRDWQDRLTRDVCLSSVATYTGHIRAFYDWCEEYGELKSSPARRLPVPAIRPRLPRPIPEGELKLALECADEPILTWLLLAGWMGLRVMEIAAISKSSLTDMDGRMLLSGIGKGNKPFRLPVPHAVEPYLRNHQRNAIGPLWRNSHGQPLGAKRLGEQANKFLRDLGLLYTMHTLRHRFGTVIYHQTTDLALTQDVMRHGSPVTTRLYVAVGGQRGAEAMDELSAELRRGPRRVS